MEVLQWKLGQELLALGLTVIIEWGTWARSGRDALRLGARALNIGVQSSLLPIISCNFKRHAESYCYCCLWPHLGLFDVQQDDMGSGGESL